MTNDLKFAGKMPVVINKNTSSVDLFEPIRSSSCDITVVNNKVLSDLYTADKLGIKVKVEKVTKNSTTTLFEGYMTPNTYSQHLSPNLDTIEMTAIDPLAILKYIYVDDLLDKARTITIGELLGKALALVKLDCNYITIEDCVVYKDDSQTNIDFLNLKIQTNNFWDEGGDPSTVYDAISECLRLFGLTLTFTGTEYAIYNVISAHDYGNAGGSYNWRGFTDYEIFDSGVLNELGGGSVYLSNKCFSHKNGDWTTIDDNPTMSIDNTYEQITGVASTKIPNLSQTAFDLISSENVTLYNAGYLNLNINPLGGYRNDEVGKVKSAHTSEDWFYIWNGVYINPDFKLDVTNLDIDSDYLTSGYANINNMYEYALGKTGHKTATGSILNFYGGEDNPSGTDRNPQTERTVDIKECITVFCEDNGIVPEFLEKSYLSWDFGANADVYTGRELAYLNPNANIFGSNKNTGLVNKIAYRQVYESVTLSKNSEQVFNLDLTHRYSRTGYSDVIDIHNYSLIGEPNATPTDDRVFIVRSDRETGKYTTGIYYGKAYLYPDCWRSENIVVDNVYFDNYNTDKDDRISPVWDIRPVVLYIDLEDGTRYQFNGKDWVDASDKRLLGNTTDYAFNFKKLMNYKNIFRDDFNYDLIQMSKSFGGETFSLNEEGFIYYTDNNGDIYNNDEKGTKQEIEYLLNADNEWKLFIDSCSEGELSIKLPNIDAINATIVCEIYTSNLLGRTGKKNNSAPKKTIETVNYAMNGKALIQDPNTLQITQGVLSSNIVGDKFNTVQKTTADIDFIPVNATYIKAEHLQLDVSITVPESNLGQMFGESDIKYKTNPSKKFREPYDAPTFQVNTKHPIVAQSHSYLIANDKFAEPSKFSMGSGNTKVTGRPENYVIQGYKNFYSVIRRHYDRVLLPNKEQFDNLMCYIEVPDLQDNGHGRWFIVVSDSYDVKTNRHTISAVEDYDLNVTEIQNYTVIEIPRESRNPRYNLMSVKRTNINKTRYK